MEHKKHFLEDLFNKVYKRKATQQEKDLADRWYNQLDLKPGEAFSSKEKEEHVRIRMLANLTRHISGQRKPSGLHLLPLWTRSIAAALVLAVLPAGIYSVYQTFLSIETFRAIADNGIKQVTLPDGTIVTLNKSAQISWDSSFDKAERRVVLSGEAFFDVKKDPHHPFILQSQNISTTVLGTAFNVESYAPEKQIKVSLIRGLVKINDDKEPQNHAELKPGQMMAYNKENRKLEVKPIAVENPSAWIKGDLVFNDIPLASAIERLKAKYNLKIKYDKLQLQGKTVTASFHNADWQETLHSILFMHDLDYKLTNNVITIR